jgi:hypothetical protein
MDAREAGRNGPASLFCSGNVSVKCRGTITPTKLEDKIHKKITVTVVMNIKGRLFSNPAFSF